MEISARTVACCRFGGHRDKLNQATSFPFEIYEAMAYEAVLEAINDAIAGYSEQIAAEQDGRAPKASRIEWLEMRTDHAIAIRDSLNVTDSDNVRQALLEYSGIVCARDNFNSIMSG